MTPKIKNILIIVAVGVVLMLVYVFFIRSTGEEENGLVSTSSNNELIPTTNQDSLDTKDFLSVLLSVKSIRLDDAIFSDISFTNLNDSNIVLTPDGNEGRPNPFAPIGADAALPPVNNKPSSTPANPPSNPQTSMLPPILETIPTTNQ
jgi:hypothetical protein